MPLRWYDRVSRALFGTPRLQQAVFATLARTNRPNEFLVCPPGFGPSEPDEISPTFNVSVTALRAAWFEMLEAEPRVRRVEGEPHDTQFEFEVRTRILRFPDRVTVAFIPIDENRASLAIYSRALFGYYDFGVNARRTRRWLLRLRKKIESAVEPRAGSG